MIHRRGTRSLGGRTTKGGVLKGMAVLVVAAVAVACDDAGPMDPVGSPPVWRVEVNPDTVVLTVGQSHTLVARTFAQDSTVLTGRTVTWISADTTLASVGADGVVRARRNGTVVITARSENRTGTGVVKVVPTAPAGTPTAGAH